MRLGSIPRMTRACAHAHRPPLRQLLVGRLGAGRIGEALDQHVALRILAHHRRQLIDAGQRARPQVRHARHRRARRRTSPPGPARSPSPAARAAGWRADRHAAAPAAPASGRCVCLRLRGRIRLAAARLELDRIAFARGLLDGALGLPALAGRHRQVDLALRKIGEMVDFGPCRRRPATRARRAAPPASARSSSVGVSSARAVLRRACSSALCAAVSRSFGVGDAANRPTGTAACEQRRQDAREPRLTVATRLSVAMLGCACFSICHCSFSSLHRAGRGSFATQRLQACCPAPPSPGWPWRGGPFLPPAPPPPSPARRHAGRPRTPWPHGPARRR